MVVVPILVEQSDRKLTNCYGRPVALPVNLAGRRGSNGRIGVDNGRRGSNGRIGLENGGRRGSNGRIGIDRRGSYSKLITDNGRRGSYGRIGVDTGRRGSNGRIDTGGRRGSFGLKGTASDVNRRGSIGRKTEMAGGGRRGSYGRTEMKFPADTLLARRGSGQGGRQLVKKGSRQNLKTLQIKICVEDDFDSSKDKAEKQQDGDKDKDTEEKGKREEKEDKENNRPKQKKDKVEQGRWDKVDRGVVRVRGGGEANLKPVSRNALVSRGGGAPYTKKPVKPTKPQVDETKESQVSIRSFSKFAKDAVNSHNKYRTQHGVAPLSLDLELCKHAQQYAETLANSCTFQHSGDPDYGENLYWAWSSDPSFQIKGSEAVDSWYEESLNNYDYNREPLDTESGHFTQLVWSVSRRLGVGIARSTAGRHIVVMKYDPPGNYVGQYTNHVKPLVN